MAVGVAYNGKLVKLSKELIKHLDQLLCSAARRQPREADNVRKQDTAQVWEEEESTCMYMYMYMYLTDVRTTTRVRLRYGNKILTASYCTCVYVYTVLKPKDTPE